MEGTLEDNIPVEKQWKTTRFNPSLHGRYSGRSLWKLRLYRAIRFQSISSWKVLWKFGGGQKIPSWFGCFNPSLHGRYSGSPSVRPMLRPMSDRFNPSLHGRYSGSEECNIADVLITVFQSISSWKVLWKLIGLFFSHTRTPVSIHLFMEGTLEDKLLKPSPLAGF